MRQTMVKYSYKEIEDKEQSYGDWWYEIVLRPLVLKIEWIFANYTKFTPNQITIISFMFSLLSAYFFLNGTWKYLIVGGFFFEFSYILDCIDGRIARLKGLKSRFGAYLDTISDFTKYFFCILGLAYGQFVLMDDISFLLLGYVFMFTELFLFSSTYIIRYNQPEFGMSTKDVRQMRHRILCDKLPFIIKLKTRLDPANRLTYIPNDTENLAFFIAPVIMKIKLGFIFGSIILFMNILALIIFNFVIKNRD